MALADSLARVLNDDTPSGEISRQASGGTAENSSARSVALKAPVMRSILSCEDVDMGTLGFDFHGYSRFLQDRGVQRKEADAFAEVTDRFVMGPLHRKAQDVTFLMNEEVATREDIAEVKGEIQSFRQETQTEFAAVRQETRSEFAAVRHEVDGFRQETRAEFVQVRQEFTAVRQEIQASRQELKSDIAQVRLEIQVAQQKAIITVGVMLATAVGILSAMIGLFA